MTRHTYADRRYITFWQGHGKRWMATLRQGNGVAVWTHKQTFATLDEARAVAIPEWEM